MELLSLVVPCFNEEETIQIYYDSINSISPQIPADIEFCFVDDGSKDNTYKVLTELAKDRPKMIALTKPNGGHGATVLYGYNYALQNNADFVFQTDLDGQTLSSEFAQFWDLRDQYDMVIGHRKGRQDGFSRVFVTKTLKLVCRICFGVTLIDANTPFRLMKAEGLKENLKYVPKDFNLSNVILSVIYAKRKQAVKYIQITFRPRQGGVNSINLKRIFKIGKQALKDFRTINKQIKDIDKK